MKYKNFTYEKSPETFMKFMCNELAEANRINRINVELYGLFLSKTKDLTPELTSKMVNLLNAVREDKA